METWLVTGGAGYIGTSLIEYILSQENHSEPLPRVFIYDNFSAFSMSTYFDQKKKFSPIIVENTSSPLEKNQVGIIEGDIIDCDKLNSTILHADRIIHLAANTGVQPSLKDPASDCKTNILGTLYLLELARKLHTKRFIHASSSAPMGDSKELPYNEKSLPAPLSPYGASKLAGESYVSVYQKTFGVSAASLRFSNIYGVGCHHKGSVVAQMTKDALQNGKIQINGNGSQTRDMLPIELLNKMIYEVLIAPEHKLQTSLFQLGTGRERTVTSIANEIIVLLKERFNKNIDIVYNDALSGDVMKNYSDIQAFSSQFFKPCLDDYKDTLSDTIDYIYHLKENGRNQ